MNLAISMMRGRDEAEPSSASELPSGLSRATVATEQNLAPWRLGGQSLRSSNGQRFCSSDAQKDAVAAKGDGLKLINLRRRVRNLRWTTQAT
jgi:hypothetical protein